MSRYRSRHGTGDEHLGYKIELDSSRMEFKVDFAPKNSDSDSDSGEQVKYYASAQEARDAILKYTKNQEKLKRAISKVDFKAVTDQGRKVTIVGVHATRGALLVKPPASSDNHGHNENLYPPVEWVCDAIHELLQLEKRAADIKEALNLVEIDLREDTGSDERHSRWSARGADHGENVDRLVKNYKARMEKAEKYGKAAGGGLVATVKEVQAKRQERKAKRDTRFEY